MSSDTRLAFAVGWALLALCSCGCREKTTTSRPAAGEDDRFLRSQLVGRWQRAWDLGPVVYERVLAADGSLVMREKRRTDPAATGTSASTAPGPVARAEQEHPKYPGKYRVEQELSGTWSVKDRQVTYRVILSNGHALTMRYDIERLTATELVEISSGVDGESEFRFRRRN